MLTLENRKWAIEIFNTTTNLFVHNRKEKDLPTEKKEPFSRQSSCDPAKPFLQSLAESKTEDPTALKFLAIADRYCKQKRFVLPVDFQADHPVEKVGRILMACLLKHQDLGMINQGTILTSFKLLFAPFVLHTER